jgi:DNA repair protein RadC
MQRTRRRRPHAGPRSIRSWPATEQPRERLARLGASALSDAELLAILLRSGHASLRASALDLARATLQAFRSWERLERVPFCRLCAQRGIGPAKAAQIKAALELGRRMHGRPLERGASLRSSRDVYRHFAARLAGLRQETFWVVLLDVKNRVIGEARISEGSLSSAIVHPREVFRPAIEESAAAVILVHNHPSGEPTPSPEDRAITTRLRDAGELVGVKVLDHVVIGRNAYRSFVEEGLL